MSDPVRSPMSQFLTFPDEILIKTFRFLDPLSLKYVAFACKRFWILSKDNMVWRNIAFRISMNINVEVADVRQEVLNRIIAVHALARKLFPNQTNSPIVLSPDSISGFPKTIENILKGLPDDSIYELFCSGSHDLIKNVHLVANYHFSYSIIAMALSDDREIVLKTSDIEEINLIEFLLALALVSIQKSPERKREIFSQLVECRFKQLPAPSGNISKDTLQLGTFTFDLVLELVSRNGMINILQYIVDAGAKPSFKSVIIAIDITAQTGNMEILKLTLKAKAPEKIHDVDVDRAINMQAKTGIEILSVMLDYLDVSQHYFSLSIYMKKEFCSAKFLEFLVEKKIVRPDSSTFDDALHRTTEESNIDFLRCAILAGALPSENSYYLAVEATSKTGIKEILDLATQAGARPTPFSLFNLATKNLFLRKNKEEFKQAIQEGAFPGPGSFNVALRFFEQTGDLDAFNLVCESGAKFDEKQGYLEVLNMVLDTVLITGRKEIIGPALKMGLCHPEGINSVLKGIKEKNNDAVLSRALKAAGNPDAILVEISSKDPQDNQVHCKKYDAKTLIEAYLEDYEGAKPDTFSLKDIIMDRFRDVEDFKFYWDQKSASKWNSESILEDIVVYWLLGASIEKNNIGFARAAMDKRIYTRSRLDRHNELNLFAKIIEGIIITGNIEFLKFGLELKMIIS